MRSESPKIDARGLKFRRNRDGTWRLYWCARPDIVRSGYEPQTVRLHYNHADAEQVPLIQAACEKLQAEMLAWASGHRRDIREFDGTLRSLVRVYQSHEASPYHRVKHTTKRTYDEVIGKIERALGNRAVKALTIRDFYRWYDEAKKPREPGQPERITKAHNLIRMLRRLFRFGVVANLAGCLELETILSHAQFKQAPRRRERLDLVHVKAFIAKAVKQGRLSLALGTALQFETAMRQKDVIGEWEPVAGDGKPCGIVFNGRRWVNGLTWADLADDLVIRKVTTKTGQIVAHDLKVLPLTLDVLSRFATGRRIGPLISDETAGRPYATHAYAREWRRIATEAGIPKNIRNMDARAGAITEAEDAGADLDEIRGAVGHTQATTTARYSRGALGKSRSVAAKRLALRKDKVQD